MHRALAGRHPTRHVRRVAGAAESAPRALRPFGAGATSLAGLSLGVARRGSSVIAWVQSQPNFARVAGRPNMPQFDNIISDPNQVAFPFRVSLYLALF